MVVMMQLSAAAREAQIGKKFRLLDRVLSARQSFRKGMKY